MPEKISFVIPYIHEYPAIAHTLFSIQSEMEDSPYNWDSIVVENGTEDENTPRWFKEPRGVFRDELGKRIKYMFDPIQCGPHARNTGARASDADYVIFMDAHTGLGKNSITPLVEFLKDTPNAALVSGLTSWSTYRYPSLGAFYELFLLPAQQATHNGGRTLDVAMHGHYLPTGYLMDRHLNEYNNKLPVKIVMGSQAYTMYRRRDFLDMGGYCDAARFYPHPEGYMPLKAQMMGKDVYVHLGSYHYHSMFPRSYASSNLRKVTDKIAGIVGDVSINDTVKLEQIRGALAYNNPDETQIKIQEYGGFSWQEHGHMNVYKIAYILGEEKWANICRKSIGEESGTRFDEDKLLALAIEQAKPIREALANKFIHTLDEVLTNARKEHMPGMENWFDPIGPDPLKG